MPKTVVEEREGRVAYEAAVREAWSNISHFFIQGMYRQAYRALRELYKTLYERDREGWLTQVENNEGNLNDGRAKRMLNPNRAEDRYLNPRIYHKYWRELHKAFSDFAQEAEKFHYSRRIEMGRE